MARRGISTTWYLAGVDGEDEVDVVGSCGGGEVDGAGDAAVDDVPDEAEDAAAAVELGVDDADASVAGIVDADDAATSAAAEDLDEDPAPEPPPHDAHKAAARIIAADRIAAPPSRVLNSSPNELKRMLFRAQSASCRRVRVNVELSLCAHRPPAKRGAPAIDIGRSE